MARIHPAFKSRGGHNVSLPCSLLTARHIEVFQESCVRARVSIPSVATRSLLSLLQTDDFTEAVLLPSVLGEGIPYLLAFIERHALMN
jgi:hypothetical protein